MKQKQDKRKLYIRFLGGVGEIGKNMTAFEYGKDIIVVDAGLAFPTEDMPGIDLVVQDISYLINNKDRVRGVVLTHGHEDHIGGLAYLLKELKVPVFGTKLTLTLAENKMREHKINDYIFNSVNAGTHITLGCFKVEFINVNHSITGACALSITTPVGVVFHSGDFKIDLTPINGQVMDITRISEIGKKGVLLLMCESTNVERAGYAPSETVVGNTFDRLFAENLKKRIIIATFSSNVHRLQQIINIAIKYKRKVAFSGRSMLNVAEAASKIGELNIPDNVIVDIERSKNFADKDMVIVSTGSQGEPMSVLTRMAYGDYPQVKIGANDAIIISASPIPGNEKNVYKVINNLYKMGAEVYYESLEKIHVSGHAFQEELKILHSLIKPKFFIPVHGEYRHLKKHVSLAKGMGMKESNTLIAEIGDTVELTAKSMKKGEPFQAGSRLVDGSNIDDNGEVVRDRKHLSEDGILIAVVGYSGDTGEIISGPDIINKGTTLSDKNIEELKALIVKNISGADFKSFKDLQEVRNVVKKTMRSYAYKKLTHCPVILPIVTQL